MSTVSLAEITAGVASATAGPRMRDVQVSDVTLDSREVSPGALFLACRGTAHHGLEFAEQALARGALAILYEVDAGDEVLPASVRAAAAAGRVFVAPVPHLAQQAGTIADRFFAAPSRSLAVAGVTGTNGKTTCAYLLAQALALLGRRTGYLGTLGCGLPGSITRLDLTTPDAVTVHRCLAKLHALGAECVAMEVSSHALEQGRVNGVRFRAAAFTNLTRDHLDFHGSMESYGAAKARLFERELAARVINVDDEFGRALAERFEHAEGRLIVTSRRQSGLRSPAAAHPVGEWRGARHVRARDVRLGSAGVTFAIDSSWGDARLTTPLLGEFNVDNALTVLGVLLSLDVPLDRAVAALGRCTAPPGRMEIVRGGEDDPIAIVDYAHTPDGLAKALSAARMHCAGTLRVVFGCGGDRDRGKRALMGRTARELADEIVVTDDNPRTEDPRRIVADILEGIMHTGSKGNASAGGERMVDARGEEMAGAGGTRRVAAAVHVQHDRAAAIREALARSSAGDVVLIAGKGHETCQIIGRERRPFSDQAVASECLAGSTGRPKGQG